MLNYFVLVNSENKIIVIDSEFSCEIDKNDCMPEVGYETDCCIWNTMNPNYMEDNGTFFDKNKAFKEQGIYKVEGYDNSCDTPDGYIENYMVKNIIKISERPY